MALTSFTGTKNVSALDELANMGAKPVAPVAPAVTPATPKPIPAGTIGNIVSNPSPTVAPGSPAATPVLPKTPGPGGTSTLRNPLSPATPPPQLTVPGATGSGGVPGGTGGGVGVPQPGTVMAPNQYNVTPSPMVSSRGYNGLDPGDILGVQAAYYNDDAYTLGGDPLFAASLTDAMQRTAASASANIQNAGLSGQALANQGAGQLMTEGVNAAQYGLTEGRNIQQLGNRLSATGEGIGGMALDAGDAASMRGGIAADYGASRSALDQLAGLESAAGPSGAQALLNQGAANTMQQNLALARSGRGYGGNAQAVSEALRQNSATMQSVGNASAQLRAQEDAAQRQRAAANLSTAAGLYSTQASQDQAAALQARAQNDAAQQALYGLGAQTTLQGMNQGAGLVQAGAGLGLAGRETGANLYNQGVQTGLAGNQMAMQGMQTGAGLEQQALQSTGQIAQVQGQFNQNWVDQYFAERAADAGIAANRRQQDMQLLGAGIGGAAAVGAGLLMLSDVRAKAKIRPALREDLFLSPDDALLRDKPSGSSALDELANMTGEEADAAEFDRYGLDAGERPSDAYRAGLSRYAPYAAGGPINAPTAGHGARGPDVDNYTAALAKAREDELAAKERDASLASTGKEWVLSGLRTAGQGLAHYGDYDRSLYRPQRRRQYPPVVIGGGQQVLSDEREKTDLRAAKGYSYEYKDPKAKGAAPGRQVGPMAQDLLRTSAADAVVPQSDGRLAVDSGRLTMRNTAAISDQQRRIDELEGLVSQLSGKRARQPTSAPEQPPVSADAFTRPGAGFRWDAPPEHSGNPGGFDRFAGVGSEPERILTPGEPERQRAAEVQRAMAADRRPLGPALAPPPKLSGPRTVARQAIASGLDAAALPVTLAGKGLEAAGYPNAAAHLSGMDAVEAGEWALSGREPAETRREEEWNEQDMPQAGFAGRAIGDVVGGWALGSLTGRIPGAASAGPILNAAAKGAKGRQSNTVQRLNETGLENTKYSRDTINPDKLAATRAPYRGVPPERANEVASRQRPVEVGVYPDGAALTDGRHRMLAAKEAGATEVPADVKIYDADGYTIGRHSGPISIGGSKSKPSRLTLEESTAQQDANRRAVAEELAALRAKRGSPPKMSAEDARAQQEANKRAVAEELAALRAKRGKPATAETPTPDPGKPQTSQEFAADVAAATRDIPSWNGSGKVFISDAHEAYQKATGRKISLDEFKRKLFEAHQADALTLGRADLVEAMPQDKVTASEHEFRPGKSMHFIDRGAPDWMHEIPPARKGSH